MKFLNKLTLRNAPPGAFLNGASDALQSAGSGAAAGSSFGPWGAAIGAAGGIASSALSQLLGRGNLKKQNELQRENMKLANEQNRHNALEQGVLQRMALQGAGLNINADKGAFQVAGSSALPVPVQQNPQVFDPSIFQQLISGALAESQIGLNKSQGELNHSNIELNDANISKIGEEVNEILENIHLKELQGEALEIENKWLDNIRKSEFSLNWSQVALNDFRSLSEEQQQALVPHMVKKIYSEIMLNESSSKNQIAQAKEAIANALYKDEERKYYEKYIDSVIANNNAMANLNDSQKKRVSTELLILSKEVSWYEFNQVMKAIETGTDVADAVAKIRMSRKGFKLKPRAVRSYGSSNFEM